MTKRDDAMMGTAKEMALNSPRLIRAVAWFALACALIAASALIATAKAWAAVAVDTTAPVTLELSLDIEGDSVEDAVFRAYKVGDIAFSGAISPDEDFAGYGLSFEEATAESWVAMANQLSGAVMEDGIVPDAVATTNARGVALFANLPVGLYLVEGDQVCVGELEVLPMPFMVCLPDKSAADEWIYNVEADVKHMVMTSTEGDNPSSDGGKDPESEYDNLPQTGQLWWPVPVLLIAGIALIGAGIARRNRV